MSINIIVDIWNQSSDVVDFKEKVAGISCELESVTEFEKYLKGNYGEEFQAKELIDSISASINS